MAVDIRILKKEKVDGGTVTIDDKFLNSGHVKKTYASEARESIRIPPTPHAHDFGEYFVLISGTGRLVYKDSNGNLRSQDLEKDKCYYVAADVPHQAMVSDGIVEVFFPKFDPSIAKIEKFPDQFV